MAEALSALVAVFLDKLVAVIREEASMLLGVRSELEGLAATVKLVKSLLADAENKAFHSEAVRLWLKELKDVIHDADDLVEDCKAAAGDPDDDPPPSTFSGKLPEPSSSAGLVRNALSASWSFLHRVMFHHRVRQRLRGINSRLEEISRERSQLRLVPDLEENRHRARSIRHEASSGVVETDITGETIRLDAKKLVGVLVGDGSCGMELVAITGMGGIGKTTLAQMLYGDQFVTAQMRGAGGGSKVLMTTRFEAVAKRVGAAHLHPVARMTAVEGWFLLCRKVFVHGEAFEEMESLKDVGLGIVERCCHLPLAIKVVGGALRGRGKNREEWEEVLHGQAWSPSIFPEDMKDDKVMEALHLSYADLPSHLKQCFLYLSLFPEDHVFLRPSVVRQWIAEGFVKAEEGDDASALEQTGQEYFRELVSRSLLQPEFSPVEGSHCRMHDLLRSLAQFLAEDENFFSHTSRLRGVSPKLRRLSVPDAGDADTDPEALKSKECLRTLFLFKNPRGGLVLRNDVVETLGNLRVLDLREAHIEELPPALAKLRHLRLLDVSGTAIRELPESVTGLRSLQFLLLNNCSNIRALPTNITKLKNLRALELYNGTEIDQMPKGMGAMTQLRNLKDFVVDGAERTLNELGPLANLRLLAISKLERVSGGEEARRAALGTKPLVYLGLQSAVAPSDEQVGSMNRMADVFDALRPPPSLQYLNIVGYAGNALPAWMWPSAAPAGAAPIQNLVSVVLDRCTNFSQLPPLGLFPNLKILWISGAHGVTSAISSTNYRDVISSTTAGAGAGDAVLFPVLEGVYFIDMPNLQEIWSWEGDGAGDDSPQRFCFPRLHYLYFEDCPKLRHLPNCFSSRLKFLHIVECPALMEVGGLIVAECLSVTDSKTDELPPWLGQVSVDPCDGGGVPFLVLKLRFCLLERVVRQKEQGQQENETEGHWWCTIKRFPRGYVKATDEESAFLSFCNYFPSFFDTNVQIAPYSGDGGESENKRLRVE